MPWKQTSIGHRICPDTHNFPPPPELLYTPPTHPVNNNSPCVCGSRTSNQHVLRTNTKPTAQGAATTSNSHKEVAANFPFCPPKSGKKGLAAPLFYCSLPAAHFAIGFVFVLRARPPRNFARISVVAFWPLQYSLGYSAGGPHSLHRKPWALDGFDCGLVPRQDDFNRPARKASQILNAVCV